ncbi:MAG: C10 family peptidase [Bacteroidota bacterium]
MKKHLLLFAFIGLMLPAFAKPVPLQKAQSLAAKYLVNKGISNPAFSLTDSVSYKRKALYYIFSSETSFVLLSADDNAMPVIGYSLNTPFKTVNQPIQVAKYLETYKKELSYIVANNIEATPEINAAWESLENGGPKSTQSAQAVGALLRTTWDQEPYYNALCPFDSRENERTVTGCVATALAQVLKYWNYPETGTGSYTYNDPKYGTQSANFGVTTYNWAAMPNSVRSANSAVATLMYHCGVAVKMTYGTGTDGGSAAYVISSATAVPQCSEYALKNNFGYKTTASGIQREDYTTANWTALIKTELNAARPVLYTGFGSGGGHAFVCDGYDNNDFFHFNWGWSGNSDGYFTLNALNPAALGAGGGDGGFNSGQQMLIGVEPNRAAAVSAPVLALYTALTPSSATIAPGAGFSVTSNFANTSAANFSGSLGVAVFSDASFVDFVQVKTGLNLSAGNHFINSQVFTTTGIADMRPGTYQLYAYFKPDADTEWQAVRDANSLQNAAEITVVSAATLQLYTALTLTTGTSYTNNAALSASVSVWNRAAGPFTGTLDLDVYETDGTWVKTIQSYDNLDLCANCFYNPALTYSTSDIDLPSGTYNLLLNFRPTGGDWTPVAPGSFVNPVQIIVSEPSPRPDIYEPNNSPATATNINRTWVNNLARCITTGSNAHLGNDNDFYGMTLPEGFNYTIDPRLQDSYLSDDGNTYTLDALFAYSTDGGATFSDAFDDVMPASLVLPGGTNLLFKVAPYFSGKTGTYVLDVKFVRTPGSGVFTKNNTEATWLMYPNPARNQVSISIPADDFKGKASALLISSTGAIVKRFSIEKPMQTIDLEGFAPGIYLVNINTGKSISSRTLVIE